MPLEPGSEFAGLRVEGVVGRGGAGVVLRAVQPGLGRAVALKVLHPALAHDPAFRARFEREARLAAAIDHPNVLPVHDAGEHEGRLYLVSRLVEGGDLGDLLARAGTLEPAAAVRVVAQVGGALDAAHARGLVHRDVKPANVLLERRDEDAHAYLADFGLALDSASERLTTEGWIGTADYAAPEQASGGAVGPATDVYGLGCLAFALLAGVPPFRRSTAMATLHAHAHEPPPPASAARPGLPPAVDAVLDRALAKRPRERWPTAGAFAVALEQALAEAGVARTLALPARDLTAATQRLPGARGRGRRRRRRGRSRAAVVALGAATALLIAAAAAALLRDIDGPPAGRPGPPAAALPQPAGSGATVRCEGGSCRQGPRRVAPPVEGSSCTRAGRMARWTRIDADGGTPLLACLPRAAGPPPAGARVPDLVGARLDLAERVLNRDDIEHDTSGGGLFGIVERENWTVCATAPPAGSALALDEPVRLVVERSC